MEIILDDSVASLLETLTAPELAKALRTIDLLEEFGSSLGMPHSRHLSAGLIELRIRGKREVRILYCFKNSKAYLLTAFIKKTQTTPVKELNKARGLLGSLK